MARSRFDDVLREVGLSIVSESVPPGTRLTLSDLEDRHSISRTLARDVVMALQALGLVESRRRAGISIQPRSSWQVLSPLVVAWRLSTRDRRSQLASLTDVRAAIEPMAARLAVTAATPAQRQRLVTLATQMVELDASGLGWADEYLAADIDFHSLLLEASGNEMLYAMRGMVAEVLQGRADQDRTTRTDPVAVRHHLLVAEAIAGADAASAEAASRRQLAMVHTELGLEQP
ncbi:FadR/GntR family transcriptional regulator [Parenemella sanctibonifatiensis]|uniref:GntR family transcriptional regulator n=1 Tax=Parenemella sanctibonifatiensis TaxID=2016505 RepID=A0A255EKY1_9ACTN|nr:FCD domain-containing protein [Parenemella sanctibonifatiensis]OYN92187.1 GntR family transcriptional regulator [Parenemella sanctibonifatiensis]